MPSVTDPPPPAQAVERESASEATMRELEILLAQRLNRRPPKTEEQERMAAILDTYSPYWSEGDLTPTELWTMVADELVKVLKEHE